MKKAKGTLGYIKSQQIFTSIRTVILFAMALGIYFIAYYTLHTNKSLWSVIAVLGILPAAKSLVNTIMFFRFRSLPTDDYTLYTDCAGACELLFENVLTTSEKSYYLPALLYKNHTFISFCNKKDEDIKKITEHIRDSLKLEKLDVTVKIFNTKEQFLERLSSLSETEKIENDDNCREICYNTIKAISL